jgi:hypothetical protein
VWPTLPAGLWSKRPGRTVRHRNTQDNFYSLPLSQYKDRWIFLNLYEDDFHDKGRTFQERASPALRQGRSMDLITHSSIQFSIYHPFYAFQEKEQYLLDYFIRDIGPSCSLSSLYNPYISLMVPLCFESTILQSALLAAAANQLCLLGKDQFTEQACYYKFMALQGIRLGISSGIYDDDTIAAILMLCFHEVRLSHYACSVASSIPSDMEYRYRMPAIYRGSCISVPGCRYSTAMRLAAHQNCGNFSECISWRTLS